MRYSVALLLLLSAVLTGCASHTAVQGLPSYAPLDTQDTRLGKGIAKEAQKHNAPLVFTYWAMA